MPQQRDVVQRFFHRRIGVAKPLLHEVNAQHRAQRHRRSAVALLGVERLNQRLQRGHGTTVSISARNTAFRVCFPAFGRNPVSARLSCFIDFIAHSWVP